MATIITKNSSTASSVPLNTQLVQGELAVNVTDKRLFTENASGTVVELGTNPSSLTLPNGTANGLAFLNASKVLTTGSALTFDGTNLGIGTSSPGFRLTVVGASGAGGTVAQFSPFTGTDPALLKFNNAGVGDFFIGKDNSAGNAFGSGAAYAANLYNGANTPMLFWTNATKQMTLDASGNLGLGVTPSAWSTGDTALQIRNGAGIAVSATPNLSLFRNSYESATGWRYYANGFAGLFNVESDGAFKFFTAPSGTAGNAISFTQAMTLDASGQLALGTTTQNPYGFSTAFNINGATNAGVVFSSGSVARGYAYGDGNGLRVGAGTALIFEVNGGTERARIDSSGNLLVGTTTNGAGAKFFVSADLNTYAMSAWNYNAAPLGLNIYYAGAAPNNTGSEFFVANDTVGMKASVRSNGGIANYSGNNVNLSDRREKTNFAPAGEYLSKICAIPVQTFNYINQNMEEDPGTTLGVVAQDVQDVAPELVMESNWGTKEEPKMRLSIYQTDLQYALMKCIQEQQAIIQTLTARIEALEAK